MKLTPTAGVAAVVAIAALLEPAAAAAPTPVAASTATPVLAYEQLRSATSTVADIYTANLDGTGAVKRIVDGSRPKVSPDGTKLAFNRGTTLLVANLDGTAQTAITTAVSIVSWSPDGARLVGNSSTGLAIVTVATHAVTQVPNSAGELSPQWSPDGSLIAASSTAGQVTQRPDGSSRVVRSGRYTGPWSADGRYMLYAEDYNRMAVEGVDVLTGEFNPIGFAGGALYTPDAWSAPGQPLAGFVTVFADRPWQDHRYVVCLFTGDSVDPLIQPQCLNRDTRNASTGGITPADTNGAPAPVSGVSATITPSFVHLAWTPPSGVTDFAGAEVRYALGSTPPASVTDGLDGGRLLDNSRDLGPLPPDQPVSISVFSRDWSGNVGPPATDTVTTAHQVGSTLTGRAVPANLTYQQRSVVTGRLASVLTAEGLANAPITVARRRFGTTDAFAPVGLLHTDSSGAYGFAQAPSASFDYKLEYAGDPDHGSATITLQIRVARKVTDSVDHPRATAGTIVLLTAVTAPALVNGKTYLQVMLSNGYRTLGPHNTTTAGRVVYSIRAPARGTTLRYRVYVPGVSGYLNSYGGWVAITGT
jgi:hypothetical protein